MSKIRRIARNKWFLSSATFLALVEVVAALGEFGECGQVRVQRLVQLAEHRDGHQAQSSSPYVSSPCSLACSP